MWRKNSENKTAHEWTGNIFLPNQQFTALNFTAWVYNLEIKNKLSAQYVFKN